MTIGERIKEFRLKAGLTQSELAEKLGIPYQSIGQWERGTVYGYAGRGNYGPMLG